MSRRPVVMGPRPPRTANRATTTQRSLQPSEGRRGGARFAGWRLAPSSPSAQMVPQSRAFSGRVAGMNPPEPTGEPITAEGIEELRAELEQLEGPARLALAA